MAFLYTGVRIIIYAHKYSYMLDLVSYEVVSFVYVYTVQVLIQYNYSRVYNSQAEIVI